MFDQEVDNRGRTGRGVEREIHERPTVLAFVTCLELILLIIDPFTRYGKYIQVLVVLVELLSRGLGLRHRENHVDNRAKLITVPRREPRSKSQNGLLIHMRLVRIYKVLLDTRENRGRPRFLLCSCFVQPRYTKHTLPKISVRPDWVSEVQSGRAGQTVLECVNGNINSRVARHPSFHKRLFHVVVSRFLPNLDQK
jgi:hypothetical protein